MSQVPKYFPCGVCSQQIDISVPKDLCPFCGTPVKEQQPGWNAVAGIVIIPVALMAASDTLKFECDLARGICSDSREFIRDDHTHNNRPSGPLGRLTYEVYGTTSTASSSAVSAALTFGNGTTTSFSIPRTT